MYLNVNSTPERTKTYPLHCHDYWEIMHYTAGHGIMRTDCGNYPFSPGTIIIVPPGVCHGSHSENFFQNISIEGRFNHLLTFQSPTSVTDNSYRDGEHLAQLLLRNRFGNRAYQLDACNTYIHFLLQQMSLKCPVDSAVETIRSKILDDAFDCDIDLPAILSASGYSEDYIRMQFRKLIGKPPVQFLHQVRIDHACNLLKIYKDTIALQTVAETCGYSDYIQFTKTFRKFTGYSPREYVNSLFSNS